MKLKLMDRVKQFFDAEQEYRKTNQAERKAKNEIILWRVCALYTFILFAYAIAAFFLFRSLALNMLYLLFFLLQLGFDGIVFYRKKKNNTSSAQVQVLCAVCCVLIMAFIITISIYPFTDQPGIFFSIAIVPVAMLFIFPYRQIMLMQFCFWVAFCAGSHFFKTQEASSYDYFSSITAFVVSLLCAYLVIELRLKENESKMKLQELSEMDRMTGLYNKWMTEELCGKYLTEKGMSCEGILFIIDLDDFKQINDGKGHKAGDQALRKTARCLKECFRKEDIVGRIGGDEFLVFMKGTSDLRLAEQKAEMILRSMKRTRQEGGDAEVCCSIGIALCAAGHNPGFEKLFEQADSAMYQSKIRQKHGFSVWREEPRP